jgi:hypothetical protein
MRNILDAPSESFQHEPTALTPPWLGTSLKTYIESQGIRGVKEVDWWVQSIRWSDSFLTSSHVKEQLDVGKPGPIDNDSLRKNPLPHYLTHL